MQSQGVPVTFNIFLDFVHARHSCLYILPPTSHSCTYYDENARVLSGEWKAENEDDCTAYLEVQRLRLDKYLG
jgi:hypothetical protein